MQQIYKGTERNQRKGVNKGEWNSCFIIPQVQSYIILCLLIPQVQPWSGEGNRTNWDKWSQALWPSDQCQTTAGDQWHTTGPTYPALLLHCYATKVIIFCQFKKSNVWLMFYAKYVLIITVWHHVATNSFMYWVIDNILYFHCERKFTTHGEVCVYTIIVVSQRNFEFIDTRNVD